LLMFVPKDKRDRLIAALEKENVLAAHIGDVLDTTPAGPKRIFVEK